MNGFLTPETKTEISQEVAEAVQTAIAEAVEAGSVILVGNLTVNVKVKMNYAQGGGAKIIVLGF